MEVFPLLKTHSGYSNQVTSLISFDFTVYFSFKKMIRILSIYFKKSLEWPTKYLKMCQNVENSIFLACVTAIYLENYVVVLLVGLVFHFNPPKSKVQLRLSYRLSVVCPSSIIIFFLYIFKDFSRPLDQFHHL